MTFDDVLEQIGGFGLYQKWIFFLTCLPNIMSGFFMLNPVFLLGTPKHRCAIRDYGNDTYTTQSEVHQALINRSIPLSNTDAITFDRCHLYTTKNFSDAYGNETNARFKCDTWVYDQSVYKDTFVSKLDLVCDRAYWVASAKMSFYFGTMVGSLVSGILADRYGRKIVMFVTMVMMLGSALGLAWTNSYIVLILLQVILGGSTVGNFMPVYSISIEVTGVHARVWPGVGASFLYVVGLLIYAVIAYSFRSVNPIQVTSTLIGLPLLTYWWLMPESPRWLLSKGRVKEAESILRKIARCNRTRLPEDILDNMEHIIRPNEQSRDLGILSLFSTKKVLIKTLLILFNWAAMMLVYYGLTLNVGNLYGNMYVNFALSCLVEVPAHIFLICAVDRLGRRGLYTGSMLVCGLSCLSTLLADQFNKDIPVVQVVLTMVGKLGVSVGYGVLYIYTAELFPTRQRNAGLGVAYTVSGLGSMAAPYVTDLGEHVGGTFGKVFPQTVFGIIAFLSAILTLFLPETMNKQLQETVQEETRLEKMDETL